MRRRVRGWKLQALSAQPSAHFHNRQKLRIRNIGYWISHRRTATFILADPRGRGESRAGKLFFEIWPGTVEAHFGSHARSLGNYGINLLLLSLTESDPNRPR